ncbi:hypothetical protein Tco_0196117 [Tanacetum coccineum]
MSTTQTSSQRVLMPSLEDFDVVSTHYVPNLDHLRVELQSCPVSSQIESKSTMLAMTCFIIVVVEIDPYLGGVLLDCVPMAWGSFVGDDSFTMAAWHHVCSHAVFDAALSVPAAT